MVGVEKACVYFVGPGPENTDEVLRAVARRVGESDVRTVVVASTSGRTGVKFAEALRGKTEVVVVSHEKMRPELKERIVKLGGVAVDGTHLPFHERGVEKVRSTLYTLGQGFKVAVEVILIATDKGLIEPYRDVVGVGGTEEGADTAIIARSTRTKEIFTKDSSKRLGIREIVAMPLEKTWWE